jgi:hypothetical protein
VYLPRVSYDFQALFAEIVHHVSAPGPLGPRMARVIDWCEPRRPHPDWRRLRALDYDQDVPRLSRWLATALGEAPVSGRFQGLWFGLCNPVVDDEATADLYVIGSSRFDPTDIEWAVGADFRPEAGDLGSAALAGIYRIAYASADGLGNDAEYPLVLACGAMLARAALEVAPLAGPFGSVQGAAVGFDSGDFLFLGPFSGGRLRLDVRGG